jgi:hypothetical protein
VSSEKRSGIAHEYRDRSQRRVKRRTRAHQGRVLPPPVTPAEIALIAVLVVLWIALAFATPAFLAPA